MPLKRESQLNSVSLLPYKKLKPNTEDFLLNKKNLKKPLIRPSNNSNILQSQWQEEKTKAENYAKELTFDSFTKNTLPFY